MSMNVHFLKKINLLRTLNNILLLKELTEINIINNNGKKLIELCKISDLKIIKRKNWQR